MNTEKVTETLVGVRLTVEGLHHFPQAGQKAGKEVDYLEFLHRHNFHIDCQFRVSHDNRDIEFIRAKHSIKSYLFKKYFSEQYQCLLFEGMSCEMIAKELLKKFNCFCVVVDEDGENYAKVFSYERPNLVESFIEELDKQLDSKTEKETSFEAIIFVIGRVCSGKNYYVVDQIKENEKKGWKCSMIDVGQIVREIKGKEQREFDPSLAPTLYKAIIGRINELRGKTDFVYIIGIRQEDLFENLYENLINKYPVGIHYLNVPSKIRRERYSKQQEIAKNKGLSFEEVEEKEVSLGIDSLIKKLYDEYYYNDNFFIIKNF